MKTIKEVTNNTAIIRFVEHNNKKFKLTYDNRNGTPLGFDYRFKADILKEDYNNKNCLITYKYLIINYLFNFTKLIVI